MERTRKIPAIQPFLNVTESDTYEVLRRKMKTIAGMGITSAVLQYDSSPEKKKENGGISPFDEEYFGMLARLSGVCRELGMTYWVQDAAPFPTGAADGAFASPEYFEKGKLYIEERHTNVQGPVSGAQLAAERFDGLLTGGIESILEEVSRSGHQPPCRNTLIGAAALPVLGKNIYDAAGALDLTGYISQDDGILQFDLPEGTWRIFFLYETRNGRGRKYYMNLPDKESVRVQIEKVHALHYEKLKDELGSTWEGFFYDEPEIGNTEGYDFHCLPGGRGGKAPKSLPWTKKMRACMEERFGSCWIKLLPCLWYDCGEATRLVRYHYMDVLTGLIRDNYNGQVLPWCREKNIRYIGHVVEDENSHARLGCGPGHFFRIERDQDLAGIDLIGGQFRPGMDMPGVCWYGCADGDGEFYHYGLCKLASSEAHINPDKKGGSFCEINAVYQELSNGRFYRFLLDHLFVNGINHLVPVVTDALAAEEGAVLFRYAQRMCRMLSGSRAVVPAAVLYHAESEWAGEAMYFQTPGAVLAGNQIDYDVIPGDALTDTEYYRTEILPGRLLINGMEYRAFIIPACRYIRRGVLDMIFKMKEAGIEICFVDSLPEEYCEEFGEIQWKQEIIPVPLGDLAEKLKKTGISDIQVSGSNPWLRYSHWEKNGRDYYMFLNEDDRNSITAEVKLPGRTFGTTVRRLDVEKRWAEEIPGDTVRLVLGRLESAVYVLSPRGCPEECDEADFREVEPGTLSGAKESAGRQQKQADSAWTVEYTEAGEEKIISLERLENLGQRPGMRR